MNGSAIIAQYREARERAATLYESSEYVILFARRFLEDARRAAGDRSLPTFAPEDLARIAGLGLRGSVLRARNGERRPEEHAPTPAPERPE